VLAKQDNEVRCAPVTEEGEEVLEVGIQLFSATKSKRKDGDETEDCPDEAWDAAKRARELLAGDGGAVD